MAEICSISIYQNKKHYEINLTLNQGWDFKNTTEANSWFSLFFNKFFEENTDLSPKELLKANEKGVFLRDGRTISHPDLFLLHSNPAVSAAKKAAILWKTLPVISKKQPEIAYDNQGIYDPEASSSFKGVLSTFEFLDPKTHPHILDKIPFKTRWSNETASLCTKKELAKLEAAYLISESGKSNPESRSISETHLGTLLGTEERKNYRMKANLSGAMRWFFKKDAIISDDILAKNSPMNGCMTKDGIVQGAISSSFNRYADTVTMLRKIETENGGSDCYAGRADTLAKAQEIAEFIFLGEIDRFEDCSRLAKGIRFKDGIYELTFAVQSLLNMNLIDSQKKMFEKQLEAYRKLAEESRIQPLKITHPETGKVYEVIVNPLAISANLFNWSSYFPSILGERSAQKSSNQADKQLQKFAEARINDLSDGDIKIDQIRDTVRALLTQTLKKPWEQVLARAYLIDLLDLPEVIHCKSSVDRTGGVAIPLVFAMKEWLRAGYAPPLVNGNYSIWAIVDHCIIGKNGEKIYPFKELFAMKMLHELKMSELSRGEKGFKLCEGGILHPALRDLLPERYLSLSSWSHLFDKLKPSSEALRLLKKSKRPRPPGS